MDIHFDLIQTAGIAGAVFMLGQFIKSRSSFLQQFFFPAPVVGGIIVSLAIFALHQADIVSISFDRTLMAFFMNLFFTCVGFTVSGKLIKSSGRQGAILAVVAVSFLVVQNLVGVSISHLLGINELLGVAMGSISMSGGVGSAAAFGPTLEELGATGASAIGIAAATFGLMMGSLIGGPVARRLIDRHRLSSSATVDTAQTADAGSAAAAISNSSMLGSTLMVLIAAAIGTLITILLHTTGINFPYYVGCLFGGTLLRNLSDSGHLTLRHNEIGIISGISLNLFLSITLMSLNISALIDLALPMMAILVAQMCIMMAYAYLVTFRVMGKDYDAAVMAAGHCGIGLGQTPNALANMSAVISERGPAPRAWFVLPIITVVFISIFNPLVITLFINLFK
ncbi:MULTISPECIES: sodium/glutamate symporter [Halomonas]|uniref:sodium/glutamate symporter n=1 Tax=Halomonas TaxID=2745 RepID=UPI001C98472B|nr:MULTISPECIES: sodium/glutamate symporter [Halomonas]MBY5969270.1 sodium/glutamate symporter [Halomonas denitrificans]MBY6207949.1 sodium/glutamate symporter [Halomonas sp. DP3Y7-2]MBY6228758.1 sodium/glutamate symporter [Halomonas sp. DP3Y7-1]MCA0917258.1 sodium/glutamate symporter [Halomonas denitrificans]